MPAAVVEKLQMSSVSCMDGTGEVVEVGGFTVVSECKYKVSNKKVK